MSHLDKTTRHLIMDLLILADEYHLEMTGGDHSKEEFAYIRSIRNRGMNHLIDRASWNRIRREWPIRIDRMMTAQKGPRTYRYNTRGPVIKVKNNKR